MDLSKKSEPLQEDQIIKNLLWIIIVKNSDLQTLPLKTDFIPCFSEFSLIFSCEEPWVLKLFIKPQGSKAKIGEKHENEIYILCQFFFCFPILVNSPWSLRLILWL